MNKGFIYQCSGSVRYCVFEMLAKHGIRHAFSTRQGGTSAGEYASLNIGYSSGDAKPAVYRNREILCSAIGADYSKLTICNQVHGDEILVVDENVCGNAAGRGGRFFEADAMITNVPGIPLQCAFADCVPLLLFAPDVMAVAVVHAGWRGTVKRIAAKTAKKLEDLYGCDTSGIIAGIGPSIGACCFETDAPVANEFYEAFPECAQLVTASKDKYRVDLWKANEHQLIEAGVAATNICCAEICTACNTGMYYSFRKEQGKTGRQAAIITL